jgi:dynein assembly factor with WDR repeat domains 1
VRGELRGHEDEIFGCAWSYEGDQILTASKDNTCRLWRRNNTEPP